MLFRPRHEALSVMLLADRFLLRWTPTPDPIRRLQSVVTRPPARPVDPNIGDGKLMSRRWKLPVASPAWRHGGSGKMGNVAGGWPRSKQALLARKRFCNELGAALVSRGHCWRAGPRNYAHAGGGLARRRSTFLTGIQGTGDALGTRSSAVKGHGQVRCQPDAAMLLRAEPAMQPSGPNIVLLLVLTIFAGLAIGSVRSGWVATSSRTRASCSAKA